MTTLKLTQNIGSHELTVYASEFIPTPADVVSYKWHDRSGGLHELRMPHFCLTNMQKIRTHFHQYIASAKWSYLRSLKSGDELASMTISAAIEYAKKRPVCNILLVFEFSANFSRAPWLTTPLASGPSHE